MILATRLQRFIKYFQQKYYCRMQESLFKTFMKEPEVFDVRLPARTSADGTFAVFVSLVRYNALISDYEIFLIFYPKEEKGTIKKPRDINKIETPDLCVITCLAEETGFALIRPAIVMLDDILLPDHNKYSMLITGDTRKLPHFVPMYRGLWVQFPFAQKILDDSLVNSKAHQKFLNSTIRFAREHVPETQVKYKNHF